ncbi:MAG: ABC transporter substrate-binding protein [Helicobacteraceae bacterium]|nr:ABC transporter substrate-binding protein [Helicobacteraceae bacterium]
MKNLSFFFLLLPFILLARESTQLEQLSIRLLWLHQFEFAGYYTALERGYYKDVGIDLEIKEYEFGLNITDEVLAKKSHFGVESASVILDKMRGKDLFLLMATYQKSPFVLMARKRDDLQTLQDIRGKKVMVAPNQVSMASLNAMLHINNIYHTDYIAQQHTFNTDDLIEGKTDAMSTYLSNEPFHLKQKGVEYTIFDPAEYGFAFYSDILFTSNEFYKQNPQLVAKFYEATRKGWEYSFNNIEETAALIHDKYNSQNKSMEHLLFEAHELKKLAYVEGVEFGKFKHEVIAQIAQTYQLLNLSKSTIDLDGFIYKKALHVASQIDYKLLFQIALVLAMIFIALYYWNRKLSKLNRTIAQSNTKIATLLDNAGQGFLSFDRDFKVDSQYSKECTKLLGDSIAHKDITQLLFTKKSEQEFFKKTLTLLKEEQNPIRKNSYLSLLPSTILLHKKAVKIEYKVLEDDQVMLVLTNITAEKKLEKKVKREQEILKMTVAIVSENHIFYETIKDYKEFLNTLENQIDLTKTPKENLEYLYRMIHTFKGNFAQLFMQDMVAFIHNVESELSALVFKKNVTNEDITKLFNGFNFHEKFDQVLKTIEDILGAEFVYSHNFLKIELSSIETLQQKIAKAMHKHNTTTPECKDILVQMQTLSQQKLYDLLRPYTSFTFSLAQRLGKEIYEFDIQGDKNIGVPKKFKGFLKSLVHLFRNCVDHGIESPEERLLKEKDEKGLIACEFEQTDDILYIKVVDDGAGIDTKALEAKLHQIGVDTTSMSENELVHTIFMQNLSTKESVSDISGRGVGMSALKEEMDKLGGSIEIQTRKDEGTSFVFSLPLHKKDENVT